MNYYSCYTKWKKAVIEMNKGIYIVVRTGSSRLPQKALSRVCDKHIIEILIERMKYLNKDLADIVICTTEKEEDNILEEIALRNKIDIFRGSENNIVQRQHDCSEHFGHEIIINVDGDDILCDPFYVKKIIEEFEKNPDIEVINTIELPFGVNSMGYRRKVLDRVLEYINSRELDTGWGELVKNREIFKIKEISPFSESEKIDIRLSLDYLEDLEVFRKIIEGIYRNNEFFTQKEVNEYILKNPSVSNINKGVEAKYWENYKKNKSWS